MEPSRIINISAAHNSYLSLTAGNVSGHKDSRNSNTAEAVPPVRDRVSISAESQLRRSGNPSLYDQRGPQPTQNVANLDTAELRQLSKLKARDAEVRAHEQAHIAAAGQYAIGGPSFTYQRGPDGRNYAIGGQVQIDVSKESTPEETLQKMAVVVRAALAPAQPSSADRQIAAQASLKAAQARQEIAAEGRDNDMVQPTESSGEAERADVDGSSELTPNQQQRNDVSSSATLKKMIDAYTAIQSMA